ncbi:hypothetical protein SAMN05444274_11812 [Mariniphaga anaerophila]|uniref:Oxygen tolerance n=1 Tax=Mariniphaga anaerophila TaxID=1484053 RepID=A0A1M5G9B4_9BACT|nr:BatD family protein [Mariniphaga anaerophila]SHG00333.1 hypothetical protein SAMN05444274_11812 [Mariniphaga anaerophila]
MKFKTKIGSLVLLILIAATANAQRIKASASIDSTNILLGDQVKLFLEIDHPKNVQVTFPNVPDTLLQNVEVLGKSAIDTVEMDDESFQKQIQSYLITSFDSGSYRIPPFWFKLDLDGRIDSIPSNGVTLHVHSMQIDTTRGPTDIKYPYGAPVTLKEVVPYILGVILIAAILFFIFYAIKRKKNNQPIFVLPKKPKEPAHIVALRELDRIKQEKAWQKGKTKQYYSEVTEALRKYIDDRFEIQAMEQTSDETIACFRAQRSLLKDKTFENLSRILKLADLVKFAKYQTTPDDDNMTLVNAYFFINETKPEEKKPETPEETEEEGEDVQIK